MTREMAIRVLRQKIIDQLAIRPDHHIYILKCMEELSYRWDKIIVTGFIFFELDLDTHDIKRYYSDYPDSRGRTTESEHKKISASQFYSIVKKDKTLPEELKFFKTQHDWDVLFDQKLCAAIKESDARSFEGTYSVNSMYLSYLNSICIFENQLLLMNIYADYKIMVTYVGHNNFHLLCRDAKDKIVLDETIQPDARTKSICIDPDNQFFLFIHSRRIYACEELINETFSSEELVNELKERRQSVTKDQKTNPVRKQRAIIGFWKE